MKLFLECLPCILRQVWDASKMATDDAAVQEQIMQDAIGVLGRYREYRNSPHIAREMHRVVRAHTGNADPYVQVKQRDLDMALTLLPELERQLLQKDDRLYWALKASATGNVLDSAIYAAHDIGKFDAEFAQPFAICDDAVLRQKLQTAKTLLVIGDNTGETVFDCLLLKQFAHLKRTYAVRSAPVINDATMDEALASGLGDYAEVISTGCDSPGVLLDDCGADFKRLFFAADIVISKGQGNFETLSDCPRELFFLLKAKCPVIAHLFQVPLNGYVFKYKKDQ
ncbi:MAG TPA: ARMT1-like domain-containing protein [Candidatus Limiplasma sp.]|nr:ARMT1-like domain-containing protein [Candidatus Limiplasma sp.]